MVEQWGRSSLGGNQICAFVMLNLGSLLDVQMKMLNNQLDINLESWALVGIRDIPW